jgi:hypothetical protein
MQEILDKGLVNNIFHCPVARALRAKYPKAVWEEGLDYVSVGVQDYQIRYMGHYLQGALPGWVAEEVRRYCYNSNPKNLDKWELNPIEFDLEIVDPKLPVLVRARMVRIGSKEDK